MSNAYKGNVKLIFILLTPFAALLLTFFSVRANHSENIHIKLTASFNDIFSENQQVFTDTLPDTLRKPVVDTLSIRHSRNELDAPVTYHADDSMVLDVPSKKMYLYGKESKVIYIDNELTAPLIQYDQGTNMVSAVLTKDSLGNVIAYPRFKQGDFDSHMDSLQFNPKTQKGITKGTYTQQGEMYVYGEKIKKVSDDVFYVFRGRFTTCNLDTPHFAFVSKKIKMVNQKWAYSGMVHPEFEGVPIPIALPFGIYPLKQGRHSGLMAPSFTANQQLGLALENLGYYKIVNDNWDVVARGTIYSYGAWTASVNPRYYRRYRYQGNLSVDLQHFKTNFIGDPDYTSSRTFNVRWTHSADTKARPGVTFSANVNAGSSKFNSQVPNSPIRNFTNQLNSSITYSKVWKDKPYNLSVSANHNQNTSQQLINLNLPDIAFNVNTLYPLRRKEPIGALKWYENIGIALNSNVRSLTSFSDSANAESIGKQISNNFQWGASHNVPISLSLPQIGFLQVTPSVSYQEKWYQRKFRRVWNPLEKKTDTVITDGFYEARDMQFGVNMGTRIFGMFGFGKSSKIQAIRHEIRPTIAVNYKPNMNSKNYYDVQVDTFGNIRRLSVFENSIYGPYSEGKFGGLSFGIDNNISMKVRSRKDTSNANLKKISILDGLSLNGNYNFLADSFQLSNLTLNARTNILNKINLTATATLDPYVTNDVGQRINKLVWSKKLWTLGAFQSGNISLQSSFKGGNKKSSNSTVPASTNNLIGNANVDASGLPLDETEQEALYIRNNPGEFADFSIPWSLDFSYSMRFFRQRNDDNSFKTNFNHDVNWNTSVNLTPRWKLGATGFYNITEKKLGTISMYLSREMHCWQMAINVSPVGTFRYFNITISPKSGLLRDFKINRTRYFYDL